MQICRIVTALPYTHTHANMQPCTHTASWDDKHIKGDREATHRLYIEQERQKRNYRS